MKKILLTGSGGFLGKNLKPFLENKGFKVIAPRSSQYDFTDLKTVQNLVNEHNPDIFILAGFYGINTPTPPQDICEKNLQILNNFIFVSAGKPIFTFGSGAEFDKSSNIILAGDEAWKSTPPADLYGRTKYLISKEITKYPNVWNLRLFGLYGPNETNNRFITHAIHCVLENKPITMRQNVVFSYLEVDDLCRLVYHFVQNPPKHKFINMVPPTTVDLKTLAGIVNKIAEVNQPIIATKEGLANEYTGAPNNLLKEIPNFDFTPLEKGIKRLYEFIKENVYK
ncbi:MAG: NAD(P)-dependent oxidoreductase [Elusimicrobiaceae bacterium]|nr:NAD(P)-dependent oxidoreductase [Elusimicrobiaceae bacterium]